MDSLEDICAWLGRFRKRLRLAWTVDRPQVAAVVEKLEARYLIWRAELA